MIFSVIYRLDLSICVPDATEMSAAFNLDFEVSGIHGYVILDGVMPTLTEITCTFWMRSSDTINYGTPVSYAVEGSDNAFLLIDYNGSASVTIHTHALRHSRVRSVEGMRGRDRS